MFKLIKSVYHINKHRNASVTICGDGTGFNPMINPNYQKLSLANQYLSARPRTKKVLEVFGLI